MRFYGSTIREALQGFTDTQFTSFDTRRINVLREVVRARLVRPFDSDPIRVFVKSEPHKRSKLAEGRLRLISAVSLVDTICDRIMFGGLADRVLNSVGETPVMIGWSPIGGGSRLLEARFGDVVTRPVDMSAWDWSVDEKLIILLRDSVKEFFKGAPDWVLEWIDSRWVALFRDAVFQFGDGTQVRQPGWGIMKSGCYLTIILNSLGQLLTHFIAKYRMGCFDGEFNGVILGDDRTIIDFPEFDSYREETCRMGYLMKPTEAGSAGVHNFAGFTFVGGISFPEYRDKHVYTLLHSAEDQLVDILSSYQLLYTHVESFRDWIEPLLLEREPSAVISERRLYEIYDGL